MNYHDYLQLDKILNAQFPESEKQDLSAHDEMLFIITHQAYELWFKQINYEIDSVLSIMFGPAINDNSPELQMVVGRLNRCASILRVLIQQVDILETMTPMDFLDFRDLLRPASGFQSWQFKELEAKLGLKFEHRHGKEYYVSQLNEEQIRKIKKTENEKSLLELLNGWLERMPFFDEEINWKNFFVQNRSEDVHPFWIEYRHRYQNSLADGEKENDIAFDETFLTEKQNDKRSISAVAARSALFIMLYRQYPMLQLPFQLLNCVLEIDIQLSSWRYRHMNMVQRMIGTRIGTGGSSGKDYLKAAADKHYIFIEIARLNSFLIERRKLPVLSHEMERRLGFLY
jgi:tryptophan 2,3-dioxygenase